MKRFLILILSLFIFVPYSFSQQKASDQGAQSGSFIPAGVIMPYAGTTAPTGWVFAYGQEVSQTSATYKNLYTAIGSTYCTTEHGGTCTGGNFRLPDLRGRSIHGKDNMGGTAASRITTAATIDGTVLGKSGGTQTNTLGPGNIPQMSGSFTSGNNSVDHTHSGNTSSNNVPSNNVSGPDNATGLSGSANSAVNPQSNSGTHSHSFTTGGVSANHTHNTTVILGTASPSAVNNLAPITIMNYIIKL